MKVKDCRECKHYSYRRWSLSYQPANYHAIGMSHAYGYCKQYDMRCANVKKCKVSTEYIETQEENEQ